MSRGSEVELLKRFINMHRQIINIWEIDSTQNLKAAIFSTYMQTIYMVGQCHNLFQLEDLNGLMLNPNEISELATRTDKCYLLEVDFSYPKELHNPHNDLPSMCERMEINGVEKLVPNLRDKKNYVIHIQALNQALQHGLRLDGIH